MCLKYLCTCCSILAENESCRKKIKINIWGKKLNDVKKKGEDYLIPTHTTVYSIDCETGIRMTLCDILFVPFTPCFRFIFFLVVGIVEWKEDG